jgi:hypothetical protein
MAHHVWSVLCLRGIVDAETQQITLFEVVEKLTITATRDAVKRDIEEATAKGKVPLMTHPMQIVSWWVRSEHDVPEEGALRLRVLSPSGEGPQAGPFPINLRDNHGFRFSAKNPAVPIHNIEDLGKYWWYIMEQRTGEGEEDWETVARLPLKVELQEVAKPEGDK